MIILSERLSTIKEVKDWAKYGDDMAEMLDRFKVAKGIEDRVLIELRKKFGDFASQVTIDVILPAGTSLPDGLVREILSDGRKRITTIVDGVGQEGRKYIFHEIKATSKTISGATEEVLAKEMLTPQQKLFREVLEGRIPGELIPRGANAKKIFTTIKSGENVLSNQMLEIDHKLRLIFEKINK